MGFVIGLLTVFMVLDCVVLVFLVLIQLPKKEAGAGLAFGAGATDALFGAGSGTVLTKITRHAATIFFVMAVVLSLLQSWYHRRSASSFEKDLSKSSLTTTATPVAQSTPSATTVPGSNAFRLTLPVVESSNAPAASTNVPSATTNPPPAPAPAPQN
jgi:preprotein translocase subunit SecG